jgi:hypothetical protein
MPAHSGWVGTGHEHRQAGTGLAEVDEGQDAQQRYDEVIGRDRQMCFGVCARGVIA